MKKFQQINLFIFLNGLLIFDFLPIHPNKIFAKDVDLSALTEININSPQFEPMKIQKGIDLQFHVVCDCGMTVETNDFFT